MFWYLVICILMLYPLSISNAGNISEKSTKRLSLEIACIILWFFMAFRAISVGVDTKFYSYAFTQFADIPFKDTFSAVTYATAEESWGFDFEPGYRLYNKLLSYFSNSPQMITICNSTIIILLLYNLIKNKSPDYLLSIWLYLTLGIYQTEMNVARNAIAILIIYNAFTFVWRKQFFKYALCCILAACFHKTAILFIPIYWLIRNVKQNGKRSLTAIGCCAAVGAVYPAVSPYLLAMAPAGIDKYFAKSNEKVEALVVGLFYAFLFLLIYFMMTQKERKDVFDSYNTGTTLFVLNLCCFGLSLGMGYAARIAALFGAYIIIFIPQMLSKIKSPEQRRNITQWVAFFSGMQYIMRMCINNIGGTLPYEFFW